MTFGTNKDQKNWGAESDNSCKNLQKGTTNMSRDVCKRFPFEVKSRHVSGSLKTEYFTRLSGGKCGNSRPDHTKYHSRTRRPESEAIPPVIFVILLRAGVAFEVMCRESV